MSTRYGIHTLYRAWHSFGRRTVFAALYAGLSTPLVAQSERDAFVALIQWCANPGAATSVDNATGYSKEMVEDLETLGWLRITPDNFTTERHELLALMYAAKNYNGNADESDRLVAEQVRFEVFERGVVEPNIYYILHEELPAAATVAVFDNEYVGLGLRLACTSVVSEPGALSFGAALFNETVDWAELRDRLMPNGTWVVEEFDISEAFRSNTPNENNVVNISLHPKRADFKAEDPDDFVYAIKVQTRSSLAPEVQQ